MHKWQILTSIFVLLLVCDEVTAGDKEDVLATMEALMAAWTAGEIDASQKHYLAEVNWFGGNGGLLQSIADVGADRRRVIKEKFAAGYRVEVQRVHSDVRVYGDTAILTEYRMKKRTYPDGTTQSLKLRTTAVFVKQKGQWKLAHHHHSHLFPENPE